MGGNYSKSVYNQLMEVMERLDSMETEHIKDHKEITTLTCEAKSLRKENACLREKVSELEKKTAALEEENHRLEKENLLLRDDNERMKGILSNDSTNSSLPRQKASRRKRRTRIMAGNPRERKKEPSRDTQKRGCQKRKRKRKSGKVCLSTELRSREFLEGITSPDIVWIWK